MYNQDRLGVPIGGNEASVAAISLTTKTLYGKAVHPGGLTIGVFGDVSKEAMSVLLERQLSGWKTAKQAPKIAAANFAPKVKIHLVNKPDLDQVNVFLGHAGVRRAR